LVVLALASALCLLALPGSSAQLAVEGAQRGGTYKYGHIHWTSEGSEVEFTVEAVFRRSNPTESFAGTAVDGFAQVGDTITLTGRETPRFYFGDDGFTNILKMQVKAYSTIEDWVMGDIKLKHMYPGPSDGGQPWLASFRGCCRSSQLANNKNGEWVIGAQIDLTKASMSPRAKVLPVVSVPFRPADGSLPKVKVPAADAMNRNAVEWSLAQPWDVGNAAYFSREAQSFMSVPLQADFNGDSNVPGFSDPDTAAECTRDPNSPNSVSPGCFYRLLRTDSTLQAMTVEGWVKIQAPADGGEPGGYVMSVGEDAGRPGAQNLQCSVRDPGNRDWVNKCQISTFFIRVNETYVTVGHDLDRSAFDTVVGGNNIIASPAAVTREAAFRVCSHPTACAETGGSLVNKWVHVAVQRYQRGAPSTDGTSRSWMHSYRVLLNGHVLEISKYPGGPRVAGEVEYDPGESDKLEGPRAANTGPTCCTGSSCTCNFASAWDCGCMVNFQVGGALIFGAYRGASRAEAFFEGHLDEWRIWNGYRPSTEIVDDIQRKLRPELNDAYGNPADPSLVVLQDPPTRTTKTESRVSTLLALYNFDQSQAASTTCALSGMTGCPLTSYQPAFPEASDPRIQAGLAGSPGVALYRAFGYNVVTSQTDSTGVVFYSAATDTSGSALNTQVDGWSITMDRGNLTLHVPNPGLYQVVVMLAMEGGHAKVPVDFIVSVLDAQWDDGEAAMAYRLCSTVSPTGTCQFPGNAFVPSLAIMAFAEPYQGCSVRAARDGGQGMVDIDSHLYPCSLVASTGAEVRFTLRGEDHQPRGAHAAGGPWDARDTAVGYGAGAMPPTARLSTANGTNPSQTEFAWTPCPADVGSHIVCFEAVDRHVNRTTGLTAPSAASGMKCVQIEVRADPPPRFEVGEGRTPAAANLTIGMESAVPLHVVDDNCLDRVAVAAAPAPGGGTQLPPGARLVPQDTSSSTCALAVVHMVWQPSAKHGGFSQDVCFVATDAGGGCGGAAPGSTTYCVRVSVARCRYALQRDEQLQDIAAQFGMDWIRLWSLNLQVAHPDFVVNAGQQLSVGHLYRSGSRRDMPDAIARRMGMSAELLRDLNFDVDLSAPLELGQELCVVPDSCRGAARSALSSIGFAANVAAAGSNQNPVPAAG